MGRLVATLARAGYHAGPTARPGFPCDYPGASPCTQVASISLVLPRYAVLVHLCGTHAATVLTIGLDVLLTAERHRRLRERLPQLRAEYARIAEADRTRLRAELFAVRIAEIEETLGLSPDTPVPLAPGA